MGRLQYFQRLDIGCSQPLGLLSCRKPVSSVREFLKLCHSHRCGITGHFLPDEPGWQCRRANRRAFPGAGSCIFRHIWSQFSSTRSRRRRLFLVWRTDGCRFRRARRAVYTQRKHAVLSSEQPSSWPLHPRSHLLCSGLGRSASHHPAWYGNCPQISGLGRSGSLDHDAYPGCLSGHQSWYFLLRQRNSTRCAHRENARCRCYRRAGIFCSSRRRCGHLDYLFCGTLSEFLRLLALCQR